MRNESVYVVGRQPSSVLALVWAPPGCRAGAHSQPWDTLDTSVSLAVLLGLALRAQGEQKAVDVRGGKSGSMIIRILSDFRIIRRDAG